LLQQTAAYYRLSSVFAQQAAAAELVVRQHRRTALEHPTEPALPAPLPRPLSDPLRTYRRLIFVFLLIGWVALWVNWLLPQLGPTTRLEKVNSATTAAALALWLCVLSVLPRRPTNAVYLRSFRNDAVTGRLRAAAQTTLGSEYRLSGIRDPRRRWPWLVRHLLYVLFLIRYAQPKYMNLEAGADWKARLWRSLGEARCALIDITAMTPFVREEIELAVRCLGLHRVLFAGDDSRTPDEWRHAILIELGSPDVPPARIRFAVWADTSAGRAAFKAQVRAFAAGLPATPPGLNATAFPDTASPSDPGGKALQGESWWAFLLASAIGVGLSIALGWGARRTLDAELGWLLPVLVINALAALLLIQYFAECGSLRARLRLGSAFLFGAAFGGLPAVLGLLTPPREGLRTTVARTQSTNNLRQIGLAVHTYEGQDGHLLPRAIGRPDGTPLLGQQVLLLSYLEQEGLFAEFTKRGEPWAGSRNLLMPYLSVTRVGASAPYLPIGVRRAGVFGYDHRTALADGMDGTPNTLLFLEDVSPHDNGPWGRGCPATLLNLDPAGWSYLGTERPFGGTHFAENGLFNRGGPIGWNTAMADGSVRFLQEGMRLHVLEALAAIARGEEIRDDW
jgi:hypothetical protein